jgi:uncharacterized membrane protein YphA (DoxX/SURF4 family)
MANSSWTRGRILLFLGRLALAGVFLAAGYIKFRQPWQLFAMQVDSYRMLPLWAVNVVAWGLPKFELLLGLLLLAGWQLRIVASLTAALLAGFFAVMVRTYALGLEINCGCFGPGEKLGTKTLIRDGSLLALAIAVAIGAFLLARKREAMLPLAAQTQKAE